MLLQKYIFFTFRQRRDVCACARMYRVICTLCYTHRNNPVVRYQLKIYFTNILSNKFIVAQIPSVFRFIHIVCPIIFGAFTELDAEIKIVTFKSKAQTFVRNATKNII